MQTTIICEFTKLVWQTGRFLRGWINQKVFKLKPDMTSVVRPRSPIVSGRQQLPFLPFDEAFGSSPSSSCLAKATRWRTLNSHFWFSIFQMESHNLRVLQQFDELNFRIWFLLLIILFYYYLMALLFIAHNFILMSLCLLTLESPLRFLLWFGSFTGNERKGGVSLLLSYEYCCCQCLMQTINHESAIVTVPQSQYVIYRAISWVQVLVTETHI